jgi:PPE-repeat protein
MTNKTNTGHGNTGHRNTGICNTGHRNTGGYNTGRHNTGRQNTGDHNTGNYHVGCFNTIDAKKAYYFNRLIDKSLWDAALKPYWLFKPSPTTWVSSEDMTDQEKAENPSYETTGGYLRVNDMKKEWRKAYESASPEDIQAVRDLPAFDYDVFEEITGLDFRVKETAPCEGHEVEIDGVTYVLKAKG